MFSREERKARGAKLLAERAEKLAAKATKKAAKGGEYSRTCQRCGTVWYLPASSANDKGPRGLDIPMAQMRAGATLFGSKNAIRLATLEQRQARVLADARCKNCGSTSYVQQAVPR